MALLQKALLVVCAACMAAPAHAFLAKTPELAKMDLPAELFMSAPELIRSRGYPVEVHEVSTEDGYFLTMHRIPHGLLDGGRDGAHNGSSSHATPLLLGHGLGGNDEQWLGRAHSLPFYLADHGYDVWLANFRGSFYGKRHATLSVKSHEFWDFSWHENGVYDQAAMTDYILAATGRPGLIMIGHSMSSTAQAVLLAERPEYAAKVLACIFMAPPIYFRHPQGVWALLASTIRTYPFLAKAYTSNVINGPVPMNHHMMFRACHPRTKNGLIGPLCRFAFDFGGGKPSEPFDMGVLRYIVGHYPSSASIRQMMHYGQNIATEEFRQYDFGPRQNKRRYGSVRPPLYNISRIISPSYVIYAETDAMVTTQDAEGFAKDLPALKLLYKVDASVFNHGDFIVGSSAAEKLYDPIVEILNKHRQHP